MSGFYLAPYIGRGTYRNMFRPVGLGDPGAYAIDLRANGGTTKDGAGQRYALLYHPGPIADRRLIALGEHGDEPLARATRRIVASALHVRTRGRHLRDLVWSALLMPPANGWSPLTPTNGRYEIWLGPQPWALRVIAGGVSASDNFNRADETPLVGNWTPHSGGGANLASNAIVGTASDHIYHWNAASFGADQDVSLTYASGPTGDSGPAARTTAGEFSGYFLTFGSNPPICKYVAGTFSTIGGTGATPSVGNIYRLTVQGTTLSAYLAGVAKGSATDTSFNGTTTGTAGPGFFIYNSGDTWDDWSAADISGVTDTPRTPTVGAGVLTGVAPTAPRGTLLTVLTP